MHRRTLLIAATALAVALMPLGVRAADNDTPPVLAGAKLVTAEDVQKLVNSGAMLIDARVASEFSDAHIKGAINVPYREKSAKAVNFDAKQDSFNLAKLPADKGAAIIIYCNGPECWKSFKASVSAIAAGYSNIYWYRGGFPDWKAKGLPVQ